MQSRKEYQDGCLINYLKSLLEMALPDLWLKLYWMIHFAFLAFAEGLAVPRY